MQTRQTVGRKKAGKKRIRWTGKTKGKLKTDMTDGKVKQDGRPAGNMAGGVS